MSDTKDRVMQVILAEADVEKGFIPDHAKNKFSDNSGNLKCPFCQQELFYTYQQDGIVPNPNKGKVDGVFCDNCKMYGNETIWEKLDHTRKALDVAKYAIKNIQEDMKERKDGDDIWEIQKNLHDYCKTTIKQITALEQKEVK